MATKKKKFTRITPKKVASLFDKDYNGIAQPGWEDEGWNNVYDSDPKEINPKKIN